MITLNQEQLQAKQQLLDFIYNSEPAIILEGIAGTGKSTIIAEVYNDTIQLEKLIKIADPSYTELKWSFTATTNKAVHNLFKMLNAPCQTIHSLLGLVYDPFTQSMRHKRKDSAFSYPDIIVIDECSFIDYKLWEELRGIPSKIIYIGDSTQLPPVGLNHSPIFHQDIPTIKLTTSMRQKDSPHIGLLCQQYQEYIHTGLNFPSIRLSDEIVHLSKEDFETKLIDEFALSNNNKILAIKNKTVQDYNLALFQHFNNRTQFAIGDTVVNNANNAQLKIDEEVTITGVKPAESFGVKGHEYILSGIRKVFTPTDFKQFKKTLNKILKDQNFTSANLFRDCWADLRPMYACTVHKSQGSTFDNVFVDLNDFRSIKDKRELAKLLYVAFSRTKHKLYLTGDVS